MQMLPLPINTSLPTLKSCTEAEMEPLATEPMTLSALEELFSKISILV